MSTMSGGTGSRQSDPACRKTHPRVSCFDWLVPTTDLVNDRGMPGDGVSIFRQFVGWLKTPDLMALLTGNILTVLVAERY